MEPMLWVYYNGRLEYVVEMLNDPEMLAYMYPNAIYFYCGVELLPLED